MWQNTTVTWTSFFILTMNLLFHSQCKAQRSSSIIINLFLQYPKSLHFTFFNKAFILWKVRNNKWNITLCDFPRTVVFILTISHQFWKFSLLRYVELNNKEKSCLYKIAICYMEIFSDFCRPIPLFLVLPPLHGHHVLVTEVWWGAL